MFYRLKKNINFLVLNSGFYIWKIEYYKFLQVVVEEVFE